MGSGRSPSTKNEFSITTLKRNFRSAKLLDLTDQSSILNLIDCLCIISFTKLSKNKYEYVRKFLNSKNIPILIPYYKIIDFKKLNIYITPTIHTENTLIFPIKDLFINSIVNLVDLTSIPTNSELMVYAKYGGDGLTDGSDYKIIKSDEQTSDNNTFVASFVILKIVFKNDVIHQIQSPSSPHLCRPFRIYMKKETSTFISDVFSQIKEEIQYLNSFVINTDEKTLKIQSKFFPSMCDGKVINAIENIKWTKECYVCGLGGQSLNNISPSKSIVKDKKFLDYGIQPLHMLISVTEWLLKISYANFDDDSKLNSEEKKIDCREEKENPFRNLFNLRTKY